MIVYVERERYFYTFTFYNEIRVLGRDSYLFKTHKRKLGNSIFFLQIGYALQLFE